MSTLPSPNMSLPIPVVSVEIGPNYAFDINNCMTLIDGHTHLPGSGVAITPGALNLNSDVTFLNNNATNFRSVRFQNQSAVLSSGPDIGCLYEVLGDLFYNNGSGVAVPITLGSSVVGGAGSISGLPSGTASAAYLPISSTFRFQSATNTAANLDGRNIILRNAAASSFGLTLSPPSAMGADIAQVLPAIPASVTSIMQMDTSGNMSAQLTPDGTSIIISGNQLIVPSGVNSDREHNFELNGAYPSLTFPLLNIDAIFFAPYNLTITSVWIYNGAAGTSGTTEFDLKVASPGGSFATILSTTGKITSAAAATIWTDSGSVVGAQTGVTKPVVSTTAITAGQAIKWDLIQSMAGTATDARIRIFYKQT